MSKYIDGFLLPIPKIHLEAYKSIAQQVASVWKEHGAIEYKEFVGDDLNTEGLVSFRDASQSKEDEVIIFGWVVFESREARDEANAKVPVDPRMEDLVEPLTDPANLIFDASRMVYGGFQSLVE